MNKVFLSGKIGRDPEIKQTNSGLAICNFSLATSESVKKGDKWEKETEWHNVVVFGGRGEYIYNNAAKGSGIVLTGRIKTETWEKNGEKKSKVVIIAEDIDITSARNEKPEINNSEKPKTTNQPQPEDDSDLPF
jgi:single-strand DNA-binding protein